MPHWQVDLATASREEQQRGQAAGVSYAGTHGIARSTLAASRAATEYSACDRRGDADLSSAGKCRTLD